MSAGLITPTVAEALAEYAAASTSRLHVALPGAVIAYDAETNLADIELQVTDSYEDEAGATVREDYPTLIGVPIVFPRSKKAFFAWEVEKGDRVAVMFASQAIDQWLGTGVKSAPGDLRRHDLSHAFAVPGLYPMTEPVPSADRQAGGAAVGIPGGNQIRFTPTQILLGKDAAEGVALGGKTDGEFTKLAATLGSFNGSTFTIAYSPASVASAKVRSE